MKRKPPKNQRGYKTPSGKKTRYLQVYGDELQHLLQHNGEIDVPQIYHVGNGYMARADHMRKWRASHETEVKP